MRIWRTSYEVLFILLIIILTNSISEVPYGDFVIGTIGIVLMELFGHLCENKKI
jgi:hypothetical protein